jgi:hypothetical protein
MTQTQNTQALKVEKEFKHALVYTVASHPGVAVVEATSTYIPLEQFKEVFLHIGKLVETHNITKLVFDKRKLTVFHQPSMEWYFVEWKEKMFGLGLKVHRKILPQDKIFRESVKIGREKINKSFPNGKFNEMDICYAESIEEALSI